MKSDYPRIVPDFQTNPQQATVYIAAINRMMSQMLPPSFFQTEGATARFIDQLPIICWTPLSEPPFDISFFLCCRFRPNAFHFFYEMVSRWLIPGKQMNALLQFAIDFFIPDVNDQKYIGGEVIMRVESVKEFETLQHNLPSSR